MKGSEIIGIVVCTDKETVAKLNKEAGQ